MNDTNELQRQILDVVALIPFGKVATYGQIAKLAGLPKHARLVGTVLKNLDEGSQLPWHRVINSQGKVSTTNLDEHGENRKLKLLKNEDVLLENYKIKLKDYQWIF
ncbi:MGMT family protein [Acinetobacter junii]|uniref:MGMT family protein n=1 Tax=Acinetobacter junii TaxID=40215 RepID=UPI0009509F91|nr:MGMT family protein [Acinetobacter junii]APU49439.1 methyltransferase [Acinetobacter junii]MDU2409083.1 MGMT family protein [Acinetobacter junii]MEB8381915.1 MGMT family protein [Acinetobacter junii]TID64334.1 methyltransferase [Acinetobacter junii]